MRHYILLLIFSLLSISLSNAQDNQLHEKELLSTRSSATNNSGSFFVAGDENTYYPVVFIDQGWGSSKATILEIGRSSAHTDKSWNGSLIASFKFHLTRWGHGSNFIEADIKQLQERLFIAGWKDTSGANNYLNLIIWLRGNATYYYHSNYNQSPQITIGTVNIAGINYYPKYKIDDYVNTNGKTLSHSIKVNSSSPSSFAGKVGIGTSDPKNMLDVAGTISAREVKVEISAGADHVFSSDYDLKPLSEVANFIQENKHLPEIPSEKQMQEEGLYLIIKKLSNFYMKSIALRKDFQRT